MKRKLMIGGAIAASAILIITIILLTGSESVEIERLSGYSEYENYLIRKEAEKAEELGQRGIKSLDFVESFFRLERNFSLSEEELDKKLSNPVGMQLSDEFVKTLRTELIPTATKTIQSNNYEFSSAPTRDGLLHIQIQGQKLHEGSYQIDFRKNKEKFYRILINNSKIKLVLRDNDKTEEINSWDAYFPGNKKIKIGIFFSETEFFVYNYPDNIILAFTRELNYLEPGHTSYNFITKNSDKISSYVIYRINTPGEWKKLNHLLWRMNLLKKKGVRGWHWNKNYPEQRVPVTGGMSSFIQRVEMDMVTRRSILLPVGSSFSWKGEVPAGAHLDFAMGIIRRYVTFSKKIQMTLTIEPGGEKPEEMVYFFRNDRFRKEQWREYRYDLAKFGGKNCKITFSAQVSPYGGKIDRNGIFIIGNPVIHPPRKKNEKNVILVSLDTLRADHLGCYGYKRRDTSPFIDKLSGEGTLFKYAISNAPWTLPSHMSIFSSLYPAEAGYGQMESPYEEGEKNVQLYDTRLLYDINTLAEILKRNGYQTAAMTLGGPVGPHYWFDQGFEEYGSRGWYLQNAAKEIREANEWIIRNKNHKFFMFLHLFEIHHPYTHRIYKDFKKGDKIDEIIANYDSGIRYTDEQLKALIANLKNLGIYEDTVVILTSDHGENFTPDQIIEDHGNHGLTLYDSELHVPLIILGGDFKGGNVITNQVSTVDIMPTVLSQTGIKVPVDIRGVNLTAHLQKAEQRERVVFSEGVLLRPEVIVKKSLRSNTHKIIKNLPGLIDKNLPLYEFYNLEKDPQETNNIYKSGGQLFKRMMSLLEAVIENVQKRANSMVHPDSSDSESNKEIQKQLQALGYIGD